MLSTSLRDERRSRAVIPETSPEDERALRELTECYDPEAPERLAQERQWAINIAFLRGFHYHRFDEQTRTLLFRPMQRRWRAYSIRNHISAYVDRRVATLSGFRPEYKVNPATEDEDAFLAAETAEKLLAYAWTHLKMPLKMQDIFYWMETTGNAFLKTYWNPTAGQCFAEDSVQMVEGTPNPVQTMTYEGDVEAKVVPTPSIHVQPFLNSPDDMEWLIEESFRPIEWVERHFPEIANIVPMGTQRTAPNRTRRPLLDFSSPTGLFSPTSSGKEKRPYCFVVEKWARPSVDYPKGQLIIAVENIIARNGDNPAPDHQIPYRWFRSKLVPGTAWGDCNVTHMISPQKDMNRLVSQHVEHIVLTGRAKVMEHSTNKLQDGAFRTEIGDSVVWSGINEPKYLQPPAMPNDLNEEIMRCSQHFDSITGQYGPARGQFQGKMSGRAIDSLVEMDMKSEEPMVARVASELEAWGSEVLKWMRDYVDSQRTVRIVGDSNQLSVISFLGADLENSTDVTIDVDSVTPKSKTFALTMIQQLTQSGILNPGNPEHVQRSFKMLAMRTDEQFVRNKMRDQRDATIENRMMLAGMPVDDAQYYQDPDAHYLTHTDCMKSDTYKKSPPVVKLWFTKHMESHRLLTIPKVGVTLAPEETMIEGTDPKQKSGGSSGQQPSRPAQSGGGE